MTTEIIKADEILPAEQTLPAFTMIRADDVVKLADICKRYIKEQKLTTNIQGKDYVNVEGWQFVGALLGLFPVVTDLVPDYEDGKFRYRCTVDLIDSNGMLRGRGIAICTNAENNKRGWQEYAIASMAQTRAVSKTLRNSCAFIVKAAGFEVTPAEEMEGVAQNAPQSNGNAPQSAPNPKPEPTPAPEPKAPQSAPKTPGEYVMKSGKTTRGKRLCDLDGKTLDKIDIALKGSTDPDRIADYEAIGVYLGTPEGAKKIADAIFGETK